MAKAAEVSEIQTAEQRVEKAKPITVSRFANATEIQNIWRVTPEKGTDPEQCLNQHYWANVSMHLRGGDEIIVIPEDMSWEMRLRVLGSGRLFAHVAKISYTKLECADQALLLPSIYDIQFAGAHHKWRVMRDGNNLKDGFETESLARRYAANHEAATQR